MRLFIALPLDATVREALAQVQERLRRLQLPVRLARAEGLHITLAFLGETAEDRVPALRQIMDRAARPCPPLRLEAVGIGCFPSATRPRVLWAGLAGDVEPVSRLHARLVHALREGGFPTEDRPFRPHVTLGRAAGAWNAPHRQALGRLLDGAQQHLGAWTVDGLTLMLSELRRDGSRYSTLYTSPLTGGPEHDG